MMWKALRVSLVGDSCKKNFEVTWFGVRVKRCQRKTFVMIDSQALTKEENLRRIVREMECYYAT